DEKDVEDVKGVGGHRQGFGCAARASESFRQTPAMICWGERDVVFPAATLDIWRQHWPHAEIHRFSDCGHWVLEDAPEEIGEKVAAFMAK
ncbi:MAG TPA: alpha/beta hydrolase, partial [Polyangia bacterium]